MASSTNLDDFLGGLSDDDDDDGAIGGYIGALDGGVGVMLPSDGKQQPAPAAAADHDSDGVDYEEDFDA
jgi:hypothetical protein